MRRILDEDHVASGTEVRILAPGEPLRIDGVDG
jgi:hypothetical protein